MMRLFPTTDVRLKNAFPDPVKMTLVQRQILQEKPQFLAWYRMIYAFMAAHKAAGARNVEIGSGSSFLFEAIPSLIESNILHIHSNDLTFDAYAMPFKDNSLDNVMLIDVLHHFNEPMAFFREACRVLRRGGRVLLCDPYLSPVSFMLWRYIHPESCDSSRLGYNAAPGSNPLLSANSASLTLLLRTHIPGLTLMRKDYHTVLHYWLAGGYNFPSFLPESLVGAVISVEKMLLPLGRLLASFAFAVWEKKEMNW
ncbi:MAG TPA: class I SAM-dependent methyltransferase [Patescibacteria group bacterium]|nr:class I SAM-dependent methyltransferase [Patescibacteria group bacterium]